ncbi:MAG TPA: LLM class flavin-dependent oxidoreductase [Candidatus Limnocylindrales bacterium]|nr:LLM class flavin-dependent oxidoreductase [Candidatus Limnocylindrales bacterium]
MRDFELGAVLPIMQDADARDVPSGIETIAQARRAEEIGFDTIWVPDELLWQVEGEAPRGAWDGVSVAGAVAAVTTRATVGTWVLSALHRNPGILAKTAETLDALSGGRFIFGLGAGHPDPGQAHAFGLPETDTFARFEEALEIIVPLLREGRADFEGRFHAARDLVQAPRGPRPGAIPLMIGGNGPRGLRLAARYGDIYSGYLARSATIEDLRQRLAEFDAMCVEVGRDPASIGRSMGAFVRPFEPAGSRPGSLSGTTEEIADQVRELRSAGYDRVELAWQPGTMAALEALAPVVESIRAD